MKPIYYLRMSPSLFLATNHFHPPDIKSKAFIEDTYMLPEQHYSCQEYGNQF